jgi:hypothetical protein
MDSAVTVSWVVNGLLGIAMWLLRNTYLDLKGSLQEVKGELKEQRAEVAHVKDSTMKKQDFNDFKQELWGRLDRFEDSIDAKIRNG